MSEKLLATSMLDSTQRIVLDFDARQHAVIVGAPGSGKTTLALQKALQQQKRRVLLLGTSRVLAGDLKKLYLQEIGVATAGQQAMTPQAFALELLKQEAISSGQIAPRLLTAVLQDELIAQQIDTLGLEIFGTNKQQTRFFATELRNLWQLLDDYDITPVELTTYATQNGGVYKEFWLAAATVLTACFDKLGARTEYSASGLLKAARTKILQTPEKHTLPQLVLVDNAQELTYGEQQLLHALAQTGVAIWLFGDPDTAAATHQAAEKNFTRFANTLPIIKQATATKLQSAILPYTYRGSKQLRQLTQKISENIGVAGQAKHREAKSKTDTKEPSVESYLVVSDLELYNQLAYQLQRLHLTKAQYSWSQMAVVCRSRNTAAQIVEQLQQQGIPAVSSGGGIVLSQQLVVRHLLGLIATMLQAKTPSEENLFELLTGPLCGLSITEAYALQQYLALSNPEISNPLAAVLTGNINTTVTADLEYAHNRLLLLAQSYQRAQQKQQQPLTQLVWLFWENLFNPEELRQKSLSIDIWESTHAKNLLDTVIELFYVLERNENQPLGAKPLQLIAEILGSDVPQDTLAKQAQQDAVTVTTAHMLIGKSYEVVCVTDIAAGIWPQTRVRNSLLGLEYLRATVHKDNYTPSLKEVIHDELRLLQLAISRAKKQLIVFGQDTTETKPGPFWRFFTQYQQPITTNTQLTLRAEVARLRRLLETDPYNKNAAEQLAQLAAAGVTGANPEKWYGAKEYTATNTVADNEQIRLRPSELDTADKCQLAAVLKRLEGQKPPTVHSARGSLLHKAFELAAHLPEVDIETLLQPVSQELASLPAAHEGERLVQNAAVMKTANGMVSYMREQGAAGWEVVATEAGFNFELAETTVKGFIDRIEARQGASGLELRVIDLKTGVNMVSSDDAEINKQLLAYQHAIRAQAVPELNEKYTPEELANASIRAVLFYPRANKNGATREQQEISPEKQALLEVSLEQLRNSYSGQNIVASVEKHCVAQTFNTNATDCSYQLIPQVSWQE